MSQQKEQGGLSVTTLIIASLASLTAAIVVHKIWQGGAILGAAITPVIVALTSEALKKPTQAVTKIRTERVSRVRATPRAEPEGERAVPPTRAQRPAAPPPPEFERPDPFGIWQDDKPSWRERLGGKHLKIALVTGAIAFGVAAVALTVPELIFGGKDSDRLTFVPGKQKKSSSTDDEKTETTEQTETVPATPEEQAPEEQAPAETTPAPAETTPAPEGGTPAPEETAPAPTPEAPAPEAPAPAP